MHVLFSFLLVVFILFSCDENKINIAYAIDEKYLYPVRVDSLWGYINQKGKLIIEPKYTRAGLFVETSALVSTSEGIKLIDFYDREILKLSENNLLSPLDLNSKALKMEKFDSLFLYNAKNGLRLLSQSNQEYHYISSAINCNRILTSSMKSFRYLDSHGKVRLEFNQGTPSDFDEETALAAIFFKNKTCFIDTLGRTKFCFMDEGQHGFSSGLALIENGRNKFFIDKYGKKALDVSHFDEVSSFINGIATIEKEKKMGCIDKDGRVIVPPIYESVGVYLSGLMVVQRSKNGKYYFIDKKNNYPFNKNFDYVEFPGFIRNLAWVKKGNQQGWINKRGEFVWVEDRKK